MKPVIIYFLFAICFTSCIITDTPGFYSGYKKLSDKEKQQVVFTQANTPVCNLRNDKKIYAITASQLLTCLKDNDTSLIYFWEPNCHSDVCITMAAAQYYCNQRNYKLYVIAGYYDLDIMEQQNTNPAPLLTVNHKYYGTDYCNAYVKRFTKELLQGTNLGKDAKYARFLFFKKDKAIFAKSNLLKGSVSN